MGLTKEIGIMQGRLSPRIGGKIQAYPANTWQKEFEIAHAIGYAAIEWIVEKPLEINALMSESGIKEIKEIIRKTGVRIDYVCADIFMQQPLVRMSQDIRKENKEHLKTDIDLFKQQIKQFIDSNPNHPLFSRWNNYYNQLNNLNFDNINYPLTMSLEKYLNDLGQPSLNPLQLP